jgi:hypothetical protein
MSDAAPESGRDATTRDHMQKIARAVDEMLPQNWGFFIMAYPFSDEPGRMNYISNGKREDVLKLMAEFIEKSKNPNDWAKHV